MHSEQPEIAGQPLSPEQADILVSATWNQIMGAAMRTEDSLPQSTSMLQRPINGEESRAELVVPAA